MIEINFVGLDSQSFEKKIAPEFQKPLVHLERELATVRSGRAHPAMVENIKATCYGGSTMSLKELAAISAPDVNLIVIEPWDKSVIPDIEKAIRMSDLGVSPVNDGNYIRISLPAVSKEHREELAKLIGQKTEECRIGIRNIRKDIKNLITQAEKNKAVSQDFAKRLQDSLQQATDKAIEVAEQKSAKKEKEVLGS